MTDRLDALAAPAGEPFTAAQARAAGCRRAVVRRALRNGTWVALRRGVPITSAARTVVDLARTRSFAAGVVVADSALRKGLASVDQLLGLIEDCSTWSGIALARRVVDFADPLAESVLESLSRVAIHEQHLPAPRTQVTLGDARGKRCRVDFLWEDVRVVGEADGLGKYEPGGSRTTRDILRGEAQGRVARRRGLRGGALGLGRCQRPATAGSATPGGFRVRSRASGRPSAARRGMR